MDIARGKRCSSDFLDEKKESKKIRRDDAILFNDIRPGMKVLGLRAKLTFKVLQEDAGLGGNLLLTSWNDLSGVEFQPKAWNEDALRINALLEVEVVYSLRDVWVFYVMHDDSRIINVKYLNFKSDSQVLHVEGASVFCCIPSLYYNYIRQPLTNAIVSNVPRFTVDMIGVFYGWEDERALMKLISPQQTVFVNVTKVLNQIEDLAELQSCQVVISLKGVRVEVVDGNLSYRCFSDSIVLIGESCPNGVMRNNLEGWIQYMNAECDAATNEYSRHDRCQG